jgi:hypothetical protein
MAMFSAVAQVRYISHNPVPRWKNPSARSPSTPRSRPPRAPTGTRPSDRAGCAAAGVANRLAKNSLTYTQVRPMNRPATGASWALKNTTMPNAERLVNATDMNALGRGSPPSILPMPSAHQCTP